MKYNLNYLPMSVMLEFHTNQKLNINDFIKDCIKCPIQMDCKFLLNLHILCHERTKQDKTHIPNFYTRNP